MTEDYNDRSKWSDEDLLNKLEQMYISDEYDGGVLHAVLLARMKPEAGGWIEIDLEKDAFQLGDVMIYTDYATMINEPLVGQIPKNFSPIAVLRFIPVPPQEPPAESDDKWVRLRDVKEPTQEELDMTDELLAVTRELLNKLKESRAESKTVDVPALSNDVPLSDPSVDVKVDSITNEPSVRENAENKDKALEIAMKALTNVYQTYRFSDAGQFAERALSEIDKLMNGEK
jgi:hypothetical protein